MNIRQLVLAGGCCVAFICIPSLTLADSAEVMPKGVSSLKFEGRFYLPTNELYNEDGDVETIADDYNIELNSGVFPDLAALEQGFGMPQSASLGVSDVDFETRSERYQLLYMYGLTDKLSLGINVYYWRRKMKVSANVNTANATVGFNPDYGNAGHPAGQYPLIPTSMGGIKNNAMATELVQRQLTAFGYDRLETWSGNSLGDIEVGGRYQYFNTENWRLAFTGGLRFPTGEVDDPDNLADLSTGEGAYAFLLHSNNDYTGIDNLLLTATLEYELVLPHEETLRIPNSIYESLTINKEKVDRDIGDYFILETTATYDLSPSWACSLLYEYSYKFEDDVSGSMGYNYETVEKGTDAISHIAKVGLTYSTIPLFKEKKFPFPMTATIAFRDRFAGENVLKSQYISFSFTGFF